MEKRKHQRRAISLELKLAILDRLAKGEGSTSIGKYYNLGESTIRAIKKHEIAIRKSIISGTLLSAKLSSYSRDTLLEKTERALVIWIEELTQKKVPTNGNMIKQKALQFYKQIKQLESPNSTSRTEKEFSASKGWLTGFLKRNAFHHKKLMGEIAPADEKAAKNFQEELAKIIEDSGYCPDQVFNADETELFWKKIPHPVCLAKSEKDRMTLLFCTNASGDKILKPLLVNRSSKHFKDKNFKQLPVHWMTNPTAWVTTAVFTEWFYNCFVPDVKKYMKQKRLDFKVLLIVDNASSHLRLEHPNVQILFFPPNTSRIVQPLDQGIISTFKKYYIKNTFQFISNKLGSESLTVIDVWKTFSILDCLNCIVSAIALIKPQILNACWRAVWPECVVNAIIPESTLSAEIVTLACEIGGEGFETCNLNYVDKLLVDDTLSDDDIIGITLDIVEDPQNDKVEEPVPLTASVIQEGLKLCNKLENHFLVNDTNTERAFKFQCKLKNCISEYQELYAKLAESSSQSSNNTVRGKKIVQDKEVNIVSTDPLLVPFKYEAVTIFPDDSSVMSDFTNV